MKEKKKLKQFLLLSGLFMSSIITNAQSLQDVKAIQQRQGSYGTYQVVGNDIIIKNCSKVLLNSKEYATITRSLILKKEVGSIELKGTTLIFKNCNRKDLNVLLDEWGFAPQQKKNN